MTKRHNVCIYIDNLNVKHKRRKNNNIKNLQKWKWKRTGETDKSFRRFFFFWIWIFCVFVYALKVGTKTWFWFKEIQQPGERINAGSKRHKPNQSRHILSITMAWISLYWESNFLKCMEKESQKEKEKTKTAGERKKFRIGLMNVRHCDASWKLKKQMRWMKKLEKVRDSEKIQMNERRTIMAKLRCESFDECEMKRTIFV